MAAGAAGRAARGCTLPRMSEPIARPSDRDIRGVSRILPDLSDDLLVHLFHRGAGRQWTARDLDYATPLRLPAQQRGALARLLTPVYFGEQTAMVGASGILPQLMRARETSAQLYLASFIMDEARHFEALTRLYASLACDPLGLRDLPELLLYHHRLRQGDRADWVWGILISDVIAKHFYRAFGLRREDPLLSGLSKRILQDESRHLAFAEHYLRLNVPRMEPARKAALRQMRDELFRLLEAMTERVRQDAAILEVGADDTLQQIATDVDMFARRVGLAAPRPDPPEHPPGRPAFGPALPTERVPGASASGPHNGPAQRTSDTSLDRDDATCFGCQLVATCGARLKAAA